MHKGLRYFKKLLFNLFFISLEVLLIIVSIKAFTGELKPIVGTVSVVGILAFLYILIKQVQNKYFRYRRPGMFKTTLSIILIAIIATFAGVQPLASYKDSLLNKMANVVNTTKTTPQDTPKDIIPNEPTPTTPMIPKTEFDEVTDRLTSPELLLSYMNNNFSYDLEKWKKWMAGDFHWDTPEEVFAKKMGDCGGHATFAFYSLLKHGYVYNNFEKHKDKATVILGLWNSTVPNYQDTHTVLLYIENGLFYTLDKDRLDEVSKKGSFDTIEEAATASLSTWRIGYFYNYDTKPWITKTIKRTITQGIEDIERQAFSLINQEREKAGLNPTTWDDDLYKLSKAHTQNMADRRECFHSYEYGDVPYGENAWGGEGYYRYSSNNELAKAIIHGWMSSPLHRDCLLHKPVKRSVVSIVVTSTGQYASWTFWMSEFKEGPPLIKKAYKMWQSETSGKIPWLTWLFDIKGYPNDTSWLEP